MAAVTWNDNAGRAHACALGGNPRPIQLRLGCQPRCTTACVHALEAERSECTLVSDALQLRARLRVTGALSAPADDCEVLVLRRADVPEPASSHADDSLYVLIMRSRDSPQTPPVCVWGSGPDPLVNCLFPADTRVPDLFPLSLPPREALHALRNIVVELQAQPARIALDEAVAAVFGDSRLDCESVDARAMEPPARCNSCFETGWVLGTYGECRRCSSKDDPSARDWVH
jgi:hypothetical protein